MTTTSTSKSGRILVVGRSPSVLLATVDILRAKGYTANATNQFDQVLDAYDVTDLDALVFGGMVPPDLKAHLREEISRRNPDITFVQGYAGIPGVIVAQIEAVDTENVTDGAEITYDTARRAVRLTLTESAHATVEAFWGTSFVPPEPTSTSLQVFDADLEAGSHVIPLPDDVPDVASFAAVTVGDLVRAFTVGAIPKSAFQLVPTSATDKRLPEVAKVMTSSDDQ